MKISIKQLACALTLLVGAQACSSDSENTQARTDADAPVVSGMKPKVEPFIMGGFDLSFERDTAWYALTAERCLFYTHVPERGDYRARVFDDKGTLVKVVYESALKPGINEIAFNPQAMEPGNYSYLLTKNIYTDTVQLCHFGIQEMPNTDVSGE